MGTALLRTLALFSVMMILSGHALVGAGRRAVRASLGPESPSSGKASKAESIREELVRLRERTGLALVTVRKNQIYEVDFRHRSLRVTRTFYAGRAAASGVVSNRGTQVAFALDMTPRKTQPMPQPACPHLICLAIAEVDGTALRTYSHVAFPGAMCWSHDDSELVLVAQNTTRNGDALPILQILSLDSKIAREIDGLDTFATSQCYSPDDRQIVYTVNKPLGARTIRVYDTQRRQTRDLGSGSNATWSPDGKWIALLNCPASLQNCTYETASPLDGERRTLLATRLGQTPLWWSPDARFVAYVSPIGPHEDRADATPSQVYRLRIRRLEDNSEDWILNLADTDVLDFQWTTSLAVTQE